MDRRVPHRAPAGRNDRGLRRRRQTGAVPQRGIEERSARGEIEKAVDERRIQLVVATGAACEGLNLQTLGTLVDIGLPWNPSRLGATDRTHQQVR
jgi:helicase-like protein